ncbi:MAG: hypothetical protein J7507_16375, partial [Pseudoxanthomonas sp.]|nr:hypothetical protein [Pseudoxanthomonas sp.]
MKTSQSKTSLLQHVQVAGVTAMLSLLGSPASAATTTFPQYPLLTGGNSIPPNIMLILDDSGSMAYPKMPEDTSTLSDSVSDRSYVNNTLYYNPAKTYLPWRTASKTLTDRLVAADFTSASTNATSPTDDKQDLRSWTRNLGNGQNPNYVLESYFYVPKAGVSNPGSVAANYDKYRVGASTATGTGAAGSYNGGAIQKLADSSIKSGTLSASKDKYSTCTQVSTGSPTSVTIKVDGDQKADLYVYSSSTCSAGNNNQNVLASSTKNENPKSVTIQSPAATIYFAILGDGKAVSGISYDVTAASWQNALPTGSARTTQQDELQNFANWYQYHRTRNKMAKAGASEAFGRLNKNYRVGFDTIWNRNTSGTSIGVTGSVPSLPIAYATNNGLFEDNGTSVTNRSTFYSRLQSATANSGTPLHGALQRAGRYFATDDPWKDSDGTKLTCRQNYAILTTDGYWNQKDGFVGGDIATYSDGTNAGDGSGNVDSGAGYPYQDNIAYTLADVAYYYWKNDLKYGVSWPDNV